MGEPGVIIFKLDFNNGTNQGNKEGESEGVRGYNFRKKNGQA